MNKSASKQLSLATAPILGQPPGDPKQFPLNNLLTFVKRGFYTSIAVSFELPSTRAHAITELMTHGQSIRWIGVYRPAVGSFTSFYTRGAGDKQANNTIQTALSGVEAFAPTPRAGKPVQSQRPPWRCKHERYNEQ